MAPTPWRALLGALGLACLAGGGGLAEPGPPITLNFEGTLGRSDVSDFYALYGINFDGAIPIAYPQISNEPSSFTAALFNPSLTMTMSSGLPIGGQVNFFLSTMVDLAVNLYSGQQGQGSLLGSFAYEANYNYGCENKPGFCYFGPLSFTTTAPFQSMVFVAQGWGQAAIDDITFTPIISAPSPVPAPAGWTLLLGGLAAMAGLHRLGRRAGTDESPSGARPAARGVGGGRP